MILAAQQIVEAYRRGDIMINPFEPDQVQGATYDFRVGEQGATTSSKKLVNIREAGYFLLQPGDFGIVTVLEEIRLGPQYAARFGLRSKYARKGLIATTGPQIDPGYQGRLIVGVTNLTPKPVSLPYRTTSSRSSSIAWTRRQRNPTAVPIKTNWIWVRRRSSSSPKARGWPCRRS